MSNAERLIRHLKSSGAALCDDCLSRTLSIAPRQQVNQLCRRMAEVGTISRMNGFCAGCRGVKIVNAALGTGPRSIASSRSTDLPEIIDISMPGSRALPGVNEVPPPQRPQPSTEGGLEVSPTEFEIRVGRYLERTYNQPFGHKMLPLGKGQYHDVDQVSADGKILVECKSYKWTINGNAPSAKITTLREAIFYLKSCPGERRIIAMQQLPFPGRELLVDYFCRLNRGLLDGMEVWDYIIGPRPDDDRVRVVVGAQP